MSSRVVRYMNLSHANTQHRIFRTVLCVCGPCVWTLCVDSVCGPCVWTLCVDPVCYFDRPWDLPWDLNISLSQRDASGTERRSAEPSPALLAEGSMAGAVAGESCRVADVDITETGLLDFFFLLVC